MNTPNPLHPQGAFPDIRGRSQVRIAVFSILAIHVVLLLVLLVPACKRTVEPPPILDVPTNPAPAFIEPPIMGSNVYVPPPGTLPPVPVTSPPSIVTPTPPIPPPTETEREHTVAKGDSFYTLGKKYNVTMKAIGDANPGVDSKRLKVGQKLKVPATATAVPPSTLAHGTEVAERAEATYTVKSGDNLTKIGKAHGLSAEAVRKANNLKTTQLKVGQKLKIPQKSAAATPPVDTLPAAVVPPPPPSMPPVAVPALPPGNN